MIKKVKKKIFQNNLFQIRENPSDWDSKYVKHVARVLIRASKKSPIISVSYLGVNDDIEAPPYEKYMEFEIEFKFKHPKTTRKANMDDIIMNLVIESL